MKQQIKQAFLISEEELKVLLQSVGCHSGYGFALKGKPLEKEEAIHRLYSMVQKEFLYSDGHCFCLREELSQAMRNMKEASEVLIVEDEEKELPVYCCYLGDKLLLCEWMSQRKNTIKLQLLEVQEFYELLEEEGYLSKMRQIRLTIHENPSGKEKRKLYTDWTDARRMLFYEDGENCQLAPYEKMKMQEMLASLLCRKKD